MKADSSLVVSLEEFGLSRYEARIYYSMLARGPISASELAYYAEIPRTKVYPTLQKLEKKNLATVSDTKPIMCTAIAPEEAFDEIIHEQINKINAMNMLVSNLKALSDESRRNSGVREGRHRRLAIGRVLEELKSMISGAGESIMVITDQVGARLVRECREQLTVAGRRNVYVRIIVPPVEVGSERAGIFPAGAQIRMINDAPNYAIIDKSGIMVIGSSGHGEVYATDALVESAATIFEKYWKISIPANPFLDMTGPESDEIYRAIRTIESKGTLSILRESVVGKRSDVGAILEQQGVGIHSKTLNDLVDLSNGVLEATCCGHATLDITTGAIQLEARDKAGYDVIWALIFDSYLKKKGYAPHIVLNGHNHTLVRFKHRSITRPTSSNPKEPR